MFIWDANRGEQMVRLLNTDPNSYRIEIREGWAKARNELASFIRELNAAERLGSSAHTEAMNRVNARMAPLRFTLQLKHTRDGLKRELLPAVWDEGADANDRTVPLGLAMIADLVAAGERELGKLHECDKCRKWFTAKRNRKDARFCEKRCQQSWNRTTEHGKAKNREYVANHREGVKREQERAKRQARRDAANRKPGQA